MSGPTPTVEAESREHHLKTWPVYFRLVKSGAKRFEVRRDDRNFRAGDTLRLREWDPAASAYTGDVVRVRVTYVLGGGQFGVEPGNVVMSIDAPSPATGPVKPNEQDSRALKLVAQRLLEFGQDLGCPPGIDPLGFAKNKLALASQGEPVALDDLQAAFDEQFHAEWQAQYKSSMKRLGKVAMASEPFFNIARKLFASPPSIAGALKVLANIIQMDDDAKAAKGKTGGLNGLGLVDLLDCVSHPFGVGEHKQQPYRSCGLEAALQDARAILALFNGAGQ